MATASSRSCPNSSGINDPVVTLILGHDEIESSRVKFHMSAKDAKDIYDWIGPHED